MGYLKQILLLKMRLNYHRFLKYSIVLQFDWMLECFFLQYGEFDFYSLQATLQHSVECCLGRMFRIPSATPIFRD
jgi:hypothetical protein